MYQMSSWTRAIVIPLCDRARGESERPVPAGFDLDELYLTGAPGSDSATASCSAGRNYFLAVDKFLQALGKVRPAHPQEAIRKCEEWMIERSNIPTVWAQSIHR